MDADCYMILGVGRDANLSQIKRAFRTLSHQLHPDRAGSAGADQFILVREAYETLSDPARRAEHERELCEREAEQARRHAPQPALLTRRPIDLFGTFEHYQPSREVIWDRWSQNFDAAHAPKSRMVRDLNVQVVIDPEQAGRLGIVPLEIPVGDVCGRCQGTGSTGYFACDACDGHGMRWENHRVDVLLSPPVYEGMTVPVSLKHLGVENMYLNLHVRIAS